MLLFNSAPSAADRPFRPDDDDRPFYSFFRFLRSQSGRCFVYRVLLGFTYNLSFYRVVPSLCLIESLFLAFTEFRRFNGWNEWLVVWVYLVLLDFTGFT